MARAHLFVDISSHGFGHLAQVAPVLNALAERLPTLRLTIRSGLSREKLSNRLLPDFTHLAAASTTEAKAGTSDFGYLMRDAILVDLPATAAVYREQHADWAARVAAEADFLRVLQPDLVFSDVAYLPLAGAAQAGIPALGMCSINWADLFAHFFAAEPWAKSIHDEMLAAYRSAETFLRLTPGMPMPSLPRVRTIEPVAALGSDCRTAVRAQLACPADERLILIAFGGFTKRLPIERWPAIDGVRWLVPADWQLTHPTVAAFEPLGWSFPDLLRAVDAVVGKPGYGTFAEAGCNGTPVLYVRRGDWPEQDYLIDWLGVHGRCREIGEADLQAGRLAAALDDLWRQPEPQRPTPSGAEDVADVLFSRLTAGS
ncbi:MAG: hypothetical protein WAZ34_01940 [Rhodocyclaceae bacterium]